MEDYYKILEINADASNKEIKRQYHLLVHAWHPDKFPESFHDIVHEKILKINEAYAVLGNSSKRVKYDGQRLSNPKDTNASYRPDNAGKENKARQEEVKRQHNALKKKHQVDRLEHRIINLVLDVNRMRSEAPKNSTAILLLIILFVNGFKGLESALKTPINWLDVMTGVVFICLGIASIYWHYSRKKKYKTEVGSRIISKTQEIQRLVQERDLLLAGQK